MMGVQPLEFWNISCPKAQPAQFWLFIFWQHLPPASHAFVERLFSVYGMLSLGRRNRVEKSLKMRVWLKVNFSVLRELECKMTLAYMTEMFWNDWPYWQLTWCFTYCVKLLTNWNSSVSSIMSLSGSQWINLSWHDVIVIIDHTSYWQIFTI